MVLSPSWLKEIAVPHILCVFDKFGGGEAEAARDCSAVGRNFKLAYPLTAYMDPITYRKVANIFIRNSRPNSRESNRHVRGNRVGEERALRLVLRIVVSQFWVRGTTYNFLLCT